MWYFPETIRMLIRSRLPTLSDEEVEILVDIFLSLK